VLKFYGLDTPVLIKHVIRSVTGTPSFVMRGLLDKHDLNF